MSLGNATHFRGPILGDDRAQGGLLEDVPQEIVADFYEPTANNPKIFRTGFVDHTFAQLWTQTNVVAGTADILQSQIHPQLRLTHNVADQGPSVRFLGTDGAGDSLVPSSAASKTFWAAKGRFTASVVTADWFMGFMTSVGAHPLAANGTLNVAGVADGVGFHLLDASNGVPTMVAWGTGVAESLTGAPTLSALVNNDFHVWGCRLAGTGLGGGASMRAEWYLDGRLLHRHLMTNAISGRMTWGVGLIANAATTSTFAVNKLSFGATV